MEKSEANKIEQKIRRLFAKACAEYSLLEDGDRVLVALSGGKDSLELIRLMGRQQHILKPRIRVEAVHVIMDNIPYETERAYITDFCKEQGIKLHILHSTFEESTDHRKTKCFLCSWNRRKAIFSFAKENDFNKVALGHHQDDILTTLLMNITFEGSIQTMPPALRMEHYPITIIRPMCLVPEFLITQISTLLGFQKQKTSCPYEVATKRSEINAIFKKLEEMNPETRYSLWKAMTNIKSDLLPPII